MPDTSDPLLSVEEIARVWKVEVATVASLVATQRVNSLDGGRLVRQGRVDVSIRASWAERVRVDSPGAARRVDDLEGHGIHPAARVAYDFFGALQDGDVAQVYALSSEGTHELEPIPEKLLKRWQKVFGSAISPDVSMTTGVYRLTPYPGVGLRLIWEKPPLVHVVRKPTPVWPAGLIPLVEDKAGWRVDLAVAELDVNWMELLQTALPS